MADPATNAAVRKANMKRIILAGGSGFLGSALSKHFNARGWLVDVLTRSPKPRPDGVKEIAHGG